MKGFIRFLGFVMLIVTCILVVALAMHSQDPDFGRWLAYALGSLVITAVLLIGCDWRRGDG